MDQIIQRQLVPCTKCLRRSYLEDGALCFESFPVPVRNKDMELAVPAPFPLKVATKQATH